MYETKHFIYLVILLYFILDSCYVLQILLVSRELGLSYLMVIYHFTDIHVTFTQMQNVIHILRFYVLTDLKILLNFSQALIS